jgi:hypothetical protein
MLIFFMFMTLSLLLVINSATKSQSRRRSCASRSHEFRIHGNRAKRCLKTSESVVKKDFSRSVQGEGRCSQQAAAKLDNDANSTYRCQSLRGGDRVHYRTLSKITAPER